MNSVVGLEYQTLLSIEMIYTWLIFVTALFILLSGMEDPFYRTIATWSYTVKCNFLINWWAFLKWYKMTSWWKMAWVVCLHYFILLLLALTYIFARTSNSSSILLKQEKTKQASTKYSRNGLFCNSFISCFAMAI